MEMEMEMETETRLRCYMVWPTRSSRRGLAGRAAGDLRTAG